MGLFSGGNSSSKVSDDDINFNNLDYGGGSGHNTNVALVNDGKNAKNYITTTDHGAVNGGLSLASKSLDNVVSLSDSFSKNLTSLAKQSNEVTSSLASKAAKTDGEKAIQSGLPYFLGAAALVGGVVYVTRKGK